MKYALQQIVKFALLMVAVSVVVFLLVDASPIDPVQANVGQAALLNMSEAKRAQLAEYWGVGMPVWERYLAWASSLLQGDWGTSLRFNAPVAGVIATRALSSLALMGIAWVASGVIGFALGVVAAVWRDRLPDRAIKGYCYLLASMPTFWIGLVFLMVFAVGLRWFPIGFSVPIGMSAADVTLADAARHLALPAIVLSLVGVANIALHTREKAIDVLESPYVRFARARGMGTWRALRRHGLRNLALPAITLQFASISEIFGGSVLVEQVFSYPGLGQAAVTAGLGSDVELLAGIALVSAALVFGGNLVANLLYGVVDPRLRPARRPSARASAVNCKKTELCGHEGLENGLEGRLGEDCAHQTADSVAIAAACGRDSGEMGAENAHKSKKMQLTVASRAGDSVLRVEVDASRAKRGASRVEVDAPRAEKGALGADEGLSGAGEGDSNAAGGMPRADGGASNAAGGMLRAGEGASSSREGAPRLDEGASRAGVSRFLHRPRVRRVANRRVALAACLLAAAALAAVVAAGLALGDAATTTDFSQKNLAPSVEHLFGTDWMGRDMLARTLAGLSTSVLVGLLAAGCSALIALALGTVAALGGKKADAVVTWLIDVVMGLPHIVLLVLISFALGKGFWGVVVGVSLTHWPSLARVVRAEVLQCKEAGYVAAARRLGAGRIAVAARHVLPYVLPQFVVGLILLFPHAILHEASITFLGFGLPAEQPAIGIILSESMSYLSAGMWWLAVFPGAALVAVVLLFDVAGSSLRRLVDPHRAQE